MLWYVLKIKFALILLKWWPSDFCVGGGARGGGGVGIGVGISVLYKLPLNIPSLLGKNILKVYWLRL